MINVIYYIYLATCKLKKCLLLLLLLLFINDRCYLLYLFINDRCYLLN